MNIILMLLRATNLANVCQAFFEKKLKNQYIEKRVTLINLHIASGKRNGIIKTYEYYLYSSIARA